MEKVIRRLNRWPRKKHRWFGPAGRSAFSTDTPAGNSAATNSVVTLSAALATSIYKSTLALRIRNLTAISRAPVLDFQPQLAGENSSAFRSNCVAIDDCNRNQKRNQMSGLRSSRGAREMQSGLSQR